jgi:hypothetical protein
MRSTRFTSDTDLNPISELIDFPSDNESCNKKHIKNYATIFLQKFQLESIAYREYNDFKDKKNIKAVFSTYSGETYRIIDLSEGFQDSVTMNIYNSKGTQIYSSKSSSKIFDFLSESSEDFTIEWIFNKADYLKPNKKCVAFALGYLNE